MEDRMGPVASGWTLIGVGGLFAFAIYRLGARGIITIRGGLDPGEWAVLVLLTVAFGYGEGVLGLDRHFVPQLVERARRLRHDRRVVVRVLAPFYGLRLVGVGRGELVRGWLTTTAIVVAVLIVRTFPEPWRGIVDFSVAVALAWGLFAIVRQGRSEAE